MSNAAKNFNILATNSIKLFSNLAKLLDFSANLFNFFLYQLFLYICQDINKVIQIKKFIKCTYFS